MLTQDVLSSCCPASCFPSKVCGPQMSSLCSLCLHFILNYLLNSFGSFSSFCWQLPSFSLEGEIHLLPGLWNAFSFQQQFVAEFVKNLKQLCRQSLPQHAPQIWGCWLKSCRVLLPRSVVQDSNIKCCFNTLKAPERSWKNYTRRTFSAKTMII